MSAAMAAICLECQLFTYQVKVVVVAMRCVQSTVVGLVCHARFEKGVESE